MKHENIKATVAFLLAESIEDCEIVNLNITEEQEQFLQLLKHNIFLTGKCGRHGKILMLVKFLYEYKKEVIEDPDQFFGEIEKELENVELIKRPFQTNPNLIKFLVVIAKMLARKYKIKIPKKMRLLYAISFLIKFYKKYYNEIEFKNK